MTRVLIVEDQSMPRTLFEMYVNQSENYTLAGSISNADMTDYLYVLPVDSVADEPLRVRYNVPQINDEFAETSSATTVPE